MPCNNFPKLDPRGGKKRRLSLSRWRREREREASGITYTMLFFLVKREREIEAEIHSNMPATQYRTKILFHVVVDQFRISLRKGETFRYNIDNGVETNPSPLPLPPRNNFFNEYSSTAMCNGRIFTRQMLQKEHGVSITIALL